MSELDLRLRYRTIIAPSSSFECMSHTASAATPKFLRIPFANVHA